MLRGEGIGYTCFFELVITWDTLHSRGLYTPDMGIMGPETSLQRHEYV